MSVARLYKPTQLLLYACLGLVLASCFSLNIVLSFELLFSLFVIISIVGIYLIHVTKLSLLSRWMVLIYVLPFSGLIGYFFSRNYTLLEGNVAASLIDDELIRSTVCSIGLLGLLGLLVGMKLYEIYSKTRAPTYLEKETSGIGKGRPLSLPSFLFFLLLALFFCVLNTSGSSILLMPYGGRLQFSFMEELNFNASALCGWVIIVVLMMDIEQHRVSDGYFLKKILFFLALSYDVIALQLLDGNRESFGMLVALGALYVTEPLLNQVRGGKTGYRKRVIVCSVAGSIIFLVYVTFGSLRESFTDGRKMKLADEIVNGFKSNTWTSVIVNNIASSYKFHYDEFHYLWGQTFVDYALSIPPGVISKFIGYERPLDTERAPSLWFEGIATGGMHPVVVPFHNFGSFGVFFVLAIYGVVIAHIDSIYTKWFWGRLWFAGTFVSSLNWFWYGDITILRGWLAVLIIGALYLIATGARIRNHSKVTAVSPHAQKRYHRLGFVE